MFGAYECASEHMWVQKLHFPRKINKQKGFPCTLLVLIFLDFNLSKCLKEHIINFATAVKSISGK